MKKFDWNDITIIPDTLSTIASRSEINPLQNGKLPIFTAPMDMVIDENNISEFELNKLAFKPSDSTSCSLIFLINSWFLFISDERDSTPLRMSFSCTRI